MMVGSLGFQVLISLVFLGAHDLAKNQVEAVAASSCKHVKEEIRARVDPRSGWHDPHNGGDGVGWVGGVLGFGGIGWLGGKWAQQKHQVCEVWHTWVFPKTVVPPNHPFVHRVFHYFHHPFWGVKSPNFWFNTHMSLHLLG